MQIQINPNPILPRPLKHPQNIRPAHLLQERLRVLRSVRCVHAPHIVPLLDRPEWDGQTDPVEPGSGDLRHVFFGDEGAVVLCEEVGEVACAGDVDREIPFVVCAGVGLEEGGGDEGFQHEETTEVYAARGLACITT